MEPNKDAAADSMLESLRKELGSIIDEDDPLRNHPNIPQISSSAIAKPVKTADVWSPPVSDSKFEAKHGQIGLITGVNGSSCSKRLPLQTLQTNVDTETVLDVSFPETHNNIEESVEKMKFDLDESYEFFKSLGEKFETMNFGNLKNRIKDLNLGKGPHEKGSTADKVNRTLEECFVTNRLDTLTTEVGEQFRKHPGEFGDIPEVSEFFQTCNQLERGLDKIKKQRNEFSDLEKRIFQATKDSCDRIDEIRKEINGQQQKP